MKNLIAGLRMIQKNFDKNKYIIKNCEGNNLFGSVDKIIITNGKIDYIKINDKENGVTETIKI